jgi:hypothetical protein
MRGGRASCALYTKVRGRCRKEWTPETEFTSSLVLRTERVFVSPEKPISLRRSKSIHHLSSFRIPDGSGNVNRQRAARRERADSNEAERCGVFANVSRDLIDDPLRFDVDLSDWTMVA